MELKKFTISFEELNLSIKQVGTMMGFDPENIDEHFSGLIEDELKEAVEYSEIKGGYRTVRVEAFTDYNIRVNSTNFMIGKKISRFLKGSETVALFVCTAGEGITERMESFSEDDLTSRYIADVIGSMTVEVAMDQIQDRLKEEMEKNGLKTTNRYSPGYCDWDISEQSLLFSFLPENFCGIRLSDSALMYPMKSVSGLIGIGEDVVFREYICDLCNSIHCIYRNKKIVG